eukprot:s1012_g13.t1
MAVTSYMELLKELNTADQALAQARKEVERLQSEDQKIQSNLSQLTSNLDDIALKAGWIFGASAMASYAPLQEEQLTLNLQLLRSENEITGAISALDDGAEVDCGLTEEAMNLQTPLRAACAKANVKMARLLLLHGADVFAHFSVDGWTALHSACHGGHDHIAKLLVEEAKSLHENTFQEGWSLLHLIVLAATERLLNRGAELVCWVLKQMPKLEVDASATRPGYVNWTPLHLAAVRGYTEILQVLLKAKANPFEITGEFYVSSVQLNRPGRLGGWVEDFVATSRRKLGRLAAGDESAVTCVQQISAAKDELDQGLTPLHLSAFGGHLRTCRALLRRSKKSINVMTQGHCWTPLMYGVWSNDVTLVRELCRVGGRCAVNDVDRRGSGTTWSPLALAVVRSSTEMVNAYAADPLARYASCDFPGSALVKHCSLALPDAVENLWSGRDQWPGKADLAATPGHLPRKQRHAVAAAARHAGGAPAPRGAQHTAAADRGVAVAGCDGEGNAEVQEAGARDQARERLVASPASETQSGDPVTFCTAQGWSPAILALFLHTVDSQRKVRCFPLTQAFPDPPGASREEIFLQVIDGLQEDTTVPQRFPDVMMTLNEFSRLCKKADATGIMEKLLHATLCMACHFNRCSFMTSIERRPLHIAASCGHGDVAQLLLDFKADPIEDDENKERPVLKLARALEGKANALQARVAQLEAALEGFPAASSPKVSTTPASRMGRRSGGGPVNNLVKRKGDADEKLRGLTVVSTEMAKYKEMTVKQLMAQLEKTNKGLSKFEHVNKKAIDQWMPQFEFSRNGSGLARNAWTVNDRDAELS